MELFRELFPELAIAISSFIGNLRKQVWFPDLSDKVKEYLVESQTFGDVFSGSFGDVFEEEDFEEEDFEDSGSDKEDGAV